MASPVSNSWVPQPASPYHRITPTEPVSYQQLTCPLLKAVWLSWRTHGWRLWPLLSHNTVPSSAGGRWPALAWPADDVNMWPVWPAVLPCRMPPSPDNCPPAPSPAVCPPRQTTTRLSSCNCTPTHTETDIGVHVYTYIYINACISRECVVMRRVMRHHGCQSDISVYRYISVQVYQCTGISVFRYIRVQVYQCKVYQCTGISGYMYISVQVYQCTSISVYWYINVQVYNCKAISVYSYINVQVYQCTGISMYRYISVQVYQCTCISVYRYINVQVYQGTCI